MPYFLLLDQILIKTTVTSYLIALFKKKKKKVGETIYL